MDYHNYTSEDFFHDQNFRKWILNPEPEMQFFWEKWMLNHPEKKEDILIARKMVKTIQFKDYEWSLERKKNLWNRIQLTEQQKTKISEKDRKVIQINNRVEKASNKKLLTWLSRAAIFTAIVVSVYYITNKGNQPVEQLTSTTISNNPKGQKSKIFLPDGSVAFLNSLSELEYPDQFSNNRTINLSGEAFFEVMKDQMHPFVVYSHGVETTVLGTSFNIKAFPDDNFIKVSVVEGEVKVSTHNNDDFVNLKPGQSATIDAISKKITVNDFYYLENIGWKDGILYFDNTNLDEAFESLELWYGVNFSFNKSPDTNTNVTGKFENTYLNLVLKSLSYSADFDYDINGKDVSINFK